MMKVFLSYSRNDSDFVLKLAGSLREKGVDIWLDQTDIPVGNRWDVEIEKALENCNTILVVLSPDSVNSQNVLDEVSYALEEGKRIIPVLYKKSAIPFRLRRFQYTDFTIDFDQAISRLLDNFDIPKSQSKPQPQVQTQPQSKLKSQRQPKPTTQLQGQLKVDLSKTEKESNLKKVNLKTDKIAHSLKRITSEGGNGNFVIFLIDSGKNYYMQAAAIKGAVEVFVEIVGNSVLASKDRLTQDQINIIKELGWEGDKGQNFSRSFEVVPANKFDHAINTIARVLEEVFGVKSEKEIEIQLTLE